MAAAKLITFEGVEGAGKTTQLGRAAAFLRDRGVAVVVAREPGGTELGEQVRDILLSRSGAAPAPLAELSLYLAARAQLVAEVIEPALAAGAVVLLDRYVHSTLAYQGYGLGVELGGTSREENVAYLRELCRAVVKGCWPDLVILLDLPPKEGLARLAGAAPDRVEARELAFHRRVREGFLALAREEPGHFKVIDASADADEVFASAKDALTTII